MKKLRKLRIWITVVALVCFLAVCAMAAWGMEHDFSDSLLIAMYIVGGIGIAAFLLNIGLAVGELVCSQKAKK